MALRHTAAERAGDDVARLLALPVAERERIIVVADKDFGRLVVMPERLRAQLAATLRHVAERLPGKDVVGAAVAAAMRQKKIAYAAMPAGAGPGTPGLLLRLLLHTPQHLLRLMLWRQFTGAEPVSASAAEMLRIAPGEQHVDTLYRAHPIHEATYIPAGPFAQRMFDEKAAEVVVLLSALGARQIELDAQAQDGWAAEASLSLPPSR